MSSTSSYSPLPRRRPRGSGPTPAPNLVAAPLRDSAQTPKGLQPLTTDVRKAQPGPRGAAPAPQRPPLLRAKACPERDGSAPLGCRSGLAEGRKKESASSAALQLQSSSEVGTHRAQRRTVPGRGASARSAKPDWQRGKGLVQEPRLPVAAWPPPVGARASPTTPVPTQSAPQPTQDPSPVPGTPPLGSPGSPPCQVVTGGDG